jgi:hypothetical protein
MRRVARKLFRCFARSCFAGGSPRPSALAWRFGENGPIDHPSAKNAWAIQARDNAYHYIQKQKCLNSQKYVEQRLFIYHSTKIMIIYL